MNITLPNPPVPFKMPIFNVTNLPTYFLFYGDFSSIIIFKKSLKIDYCMETGKFYIICVT